MNHRVHPKPASQQESGAEFRSTAIYTKDWWINTMVWILALYLFQDDSSAAPAAANGSALLEMIHNSGPVAFRSEEHTSELQSQ